jgi:hypothetical protein
MASPVVDPRWINRSILLGSGFFIVALILSAVFDPEIRVLHALQTLIYLAVIVLTRRDSPWGFGAGAWIAIFWNYTNLFVTAFITEGLQELWSLVQTGQLNRPDLLIAVVAAGGHFLMIAACLAGFVRTRPGTRQWIQLFAGGMAAIAYFVVIIATTGPQYLELVNQVFGL